MHISKLPRTLLGHLLRVSLKLQRVVLDSDLGVTYFEDCGIFLTGFSLLIFAAFLNYFSRFPLLCLFPRFVQHVLSVPGLQ